MFFCRLIVFIIVFLISDFFFSFRNASPYDQNKPSPPPKTSTYKPVPPPKPKNYRPPANVSSASQQQQQQQQQHPISPTNSNYWNHSPPGTLNPNRPPPNGEIPQHDYYNHVAPTNGMQNGNHYRYEEDTNGGFDSGIVA